MKNFIQPGDVITVPAPANVVAGQGVRVGMLFGVAVSAAASGAPVEISTCGVVRIAKVSAQAWTVGAAIFWSTGGATTVPGTGNILIGVAAAEAANPSPDGLVRLNGAAPAAQT